MSKLLANRNWLALALCAAAMVGCDDGGGGGTADMSPGMGGAGGGMGGAGGGMGGAGGGMGGAGGGMGGAGGGMGGAGGGMGDGSCDAPLAFTDNGGGNWSVSGTLNAGNHEGGCAGGGFDAVVAFTAPAVGVYRFDMFDNDFDTVLYARGDCADADSELACNDDARDLQSEIVVALEADQTIYVFADSFDAAEPTPFTINAQSVPATAPTITGAEASFNGAEGVLGVRIQGTDPEDDPAVLGVEFLDAEGAAIPIGDDGSTEGQLDVGGVFVVDAGNFSLDLSFGVPLEDFVSVRLRIYDALGLGSAPFEVAVGMAAELAVDAECTPRDGFAACPEGTRCLDRAGAGATTCAVATAPVIDSVAAYSNGDAAEWAIGVVVTGTDAESDVTGTIELSLLDAAGEVVALDFGDGPAPARFQVDGELVQADGSFTLTVSGLVGEVPQAAIDSVAQFQVVVVDQAELRSAPATGAPQAPGAAQSGGACDLAGAINLCPEGEGCIGADPAEPALNPVCTALTPPVLEQAWLFAQGMGEDLLLGFRVAGRDAEGNASGVWLRPQDAAGEPITNDFLGEDGLPVGFTGVNRAENTFDGAGSVQIFDYCFNLCAQVADPLICIFDPGSFVEPCAADLAAAMGGAAGFSVRVFDTTGEVSEWSDVIVPMAPGVLAEGDACIGGGAIGACAEGLICASEGEGSVGSCGAPVLECPAEWVVGDLNAGAQGADFMVMGDNSASEITTSGSCGGGGPVDVYRFVAPAAGDWSFWISDSDPEADHLMYARSFCGEAAAEAELACNDDFQGLPGFRSGFQIALEAQQQVFLVVDSYNGVGPGSYTLMASPGPIPVPEDEE